MRGGDGIPQAHKLHRVFDRPSWESVTQKMSSTRSPKVATLGLDAHGARDLGQNPGPVGRTGFIQCRRIDGRRECGGLNVPTPSNVITSASKRRRNIGTSTCGCPDLLLIYRKPDTRVLQLVRLGSHSELGL